VNRMAGTAVVLVSIIGLFVISIATFVPVLVTGMGDMKDSIIGRRPTWSCVILNRGWDVVRFTGAETSNANFVIDLEGFPIELAPGEQDTISIEYVPSSMAPIVATAVVTSDNEDDQPLVFRLSGNLSAVAFGGEQFAEQSAVVGKADEVRALHPQAGGRQHRLHGIAGDGFDVAGIHQLRQLRGGEVCRRLLVAAADMRCRVEHDELVGVQRSGDGRGEFMTRQIEHLTGW